MLCIFSLQIIPLSTKTNCSIWKFLITPSSPKKNHPAPTAITIDTCTMSTSDYLKTQGKIFISQSTYPTVVVALHFIQIWPKKWLIIIQNMTVIRTYSMIYIINYIFTNTIYYSCNVGVHQGNLTICIPTNCFRE